MLGSIILESLVVGILASVLGLFLGLGLANGLFSLFDAVGFTLPNTGLVFETRTVVVVAARRHPRDARREPAAGDPRDARAADRRRARRRDASAESRFAPLPHRRRLRADAARLRVARLLALRPRPRDDEPADLARARRAARLHRLRPALRRGSSGRSPRVLGWPATKIGGAAGALARDNARRNPQRTASTAAALMIGLALVTLVAVLAAGITSTFRGAVERSLDERRLRGHRAEQLLADPGRGGRAAAKAPGVEAVARRPRGRRRGVRQADLRHRRRPRLEHGCSTSSGRRARRRPRTARRRRRVRRRRLRERPPPRRRLPDHADVRRTATELHLDVEGHLRPADRRLAVRPRHDLDGQRGTRTTTNPQNLFSFVRMQGGETDANQAALEQALTDVPEREGRRRGASSSTTRSRR